MKPSTFFFIILLAALLIVNIFSQNVIEHSVKYQQVSTATLVGEDGLVMATTDGGITWDSLTSNITNTLYGNAYVDSVTSVAVGENGAIIKTTDGGANWSIMTSGTTANLYDLEYTANNCLIACGEGIILYSANGGDNWTQVYSNLAVTIKDICYNSTNNTAFAVGTQNLLLKSIDGGLNWVQYSAPLATIADLNVCTFNTAGDIIIANSNIYKSTDLGDTWFVSELASVGEINDVVFFTSGNGILVGNDGMVRKTTDGGSTWFTVSLPQIGNIDLNSAAFGSFTDGMVVGENGTELYTTDAGETWSDTKTSFSEKTVNNSLSKISNYPNPFNPSTKISFQLHQSGKLMVAVYDISGKLVQSLYNGFANTGLHEFVFNASNLSSGIYFYRVDAEGSASITNKMVLIK